MGMILKQVYFWDPKNFQPAVVRKKSTIVEFSYYSNAHWGFDPLKR